jgi:CRP-like cAMP-binding protein
MDRLKKQIHEECYYHVSDALLDEVIADTTLVTIKPRGVLIPYGKVDDSIYILKSGIVSYSWFDGLNERVFGFSLPGTLMFSYYSFYEHLPSLFQLEACKEPVIALKWSRKAIDRLIETNHEAALWLLSLAYHQLSHNEFKIAVNLSGTARERLDFVMKKRPEIISGVSMRTIASYLGITQAYLSRLKKDYAKGK